MATIQTLSGKRGKTFRVQFARDRKRVTKTFKKRKDAERFLATLTLHDDVMSGMTSDVLNCTTLSEAIKEYLAQWRGKDHNVEGRLNWWAQRLGDEPIGKISRRDIKNTLQKLIESGKAPTTYNRYKSAISAVFEYMKDAHDTGHNPARQVKQLKEGKGIERYATPEELSRLLDEAKKSDWDRLYLLILMAVSTGARRAELTNLRWCNINFKNQTAFLDDTKNGERRVLTLTDDLIVELEKFREVGSGWVFPANCDFTKSGYHFDGYWYKCLSDAKIENLRFHDLRHTTGSWLAMQGVPTTAIKEILGHKTIVTTQRYVHHSTQHKAKLLGDVFGGLSNG